MRQLSLNGTYSKFRKTLKAISFTRFVAAQSVPLFALITLTHGMPSLGADLPSSARKSTASSSAQTRAGKRKIANAQAENDISVDQSDSTNTTKVDNKKEPADENHKDARDTQVKNDDYARQYFEQERQSRKRKYAHSSSTVQIYAPQAVVWRVLIDFERYPQIFKRIDTCHITKREHGLLFAETFLKPQMFVKKSCQHTVTDISQGPTYLQWKMLDGNFTAVLGSWTLSSTQDKKGKTVCEAKYTLEADPGPVIPGPMVSFLLHQVEHEVVTSFKKSCEQTFQNESEKQQQDDVKK